MIWRQCSLRSEGQAATLAVWRRIFAWTQSRMVLPAWLGVGHALQTLVQQVPHLPWLAC